MAKKRRKYSVAERVNYHKKRASSSAVSDNQRYYSDHWLRGYNDPWAENNFRAITAEIKRNKKHMTKSEAIVYYGYRNGLKAQIDGSSIGKR